jgi:hypothetical protein
MRHSKREVLTYAPAPPRLLPRVRWVALMLGCVAALTAASVLPPLYEGQEEPFYGSNSWRDIAVMRVLPMLIIAGWAGWAFAVYWNSRARVVTMVILAVALPFAIWSCRLALSSYQRFERDQSQYAEWMAEAARAREQD